MSDTNDINFKGTGNDIDDAEGHAAHAGRMDDGSGTEGDTEGHAFRGHGGLDDGSGTDAEGHAVGSRHVDDGSGDDTEGHSIRGKGGLDDGSDTDTEGHGAPGKPRIRIPEAESSDEAAGHIAVTQQSGKPRIRP